jgi:hypothetical protein
MDEPLVVHSQLRWDFPWQRTHQLMSRLARQRDILFIEPPQFLDDAGRPTLLRVTPIDRLTRVIPRLPTVCADSETATRLAIHGLIRELLASNEPLAARLRHPVQWCTGPWPIPTLLADSNSRAVIYDCTHELAAFRWAMTPELYAERWHAERRLCERADLILTNSRALASLHARHHPAVHWVPNATDGSASWDAMAFRVSQLIDDAVSRQSEGTMKTEERWQRGPEGAPRPARHTTASELATALPLLP